MATTDAARRIDAAERFMWLNARLVDRFRFDCLFRDGDSDRVIAALRPYQNPDGGFGNALEGDFRGPTSQATTADFALRMMDDVGRADAELVIPFYDWLATVTTDGGVPMVLPTVEGYPRASWWEKPGPPGLNPTATLAAFLWRHNIEHPWRDPATEFAWRAFDSIPTRIADGEWPVQIAYDVRTAVQFLDVVPDRDRAARTCATVGEILMAHNVIAFDPTQSGDISLPLDFAPTADAITRSWFSEDAINANLDVFRDAQDEDGGWQVPWDVWNPPSLAEWRGWFTIERMKILRSYGRL